MKAATRKYYGHDGAFYPETMLFWGNYTDSDYGVERKGMEDGLALESQADLYTLGELATLVRRRLNGRPLG